MARILEQIMGSGAKPPEFVLHHMGRRPKYSNLDPLYDDYKLLNILITGYLLAGYSKLTTCFWDCNHQSAMFFGVNMSSSPAVYNWESNITGQPFSGDAVASCWLKKPTQLIYIYI